MATLQELETALRRAHAAGDIKAAQTFAAEMQRQMQAQEQQITTTQQLEDAYAGARSPLSTFGESAQYGLQKAFTGLYNLIPDPLKPEAEGILQDVIPEGLTREGIAEAQQRGMAEQALREEISPIAAGAGELVGEVAPGAAALARLPARLATKPAVGATAGGAEAGMIALGEQPVMDPYFERLRGTPEAAALGAIGGFAAPYLVSGVQRLMELGGGVAGTVGARLRSMVEATPEQEAGRVLKRYQESAGFDPEEALRLLEEMGPEATLADVPSLRGLAQGAATTPAGRQFTEAFEARQLAQEQRILNEAQRITGQEASDYRGGLAAMKTARAQQAAPYYEKAYEMPIEMNDDIQDLMLRIDGAKAWKDAEDLAGIEGRAFNSESPTMQDFDLAKRALDDRILTARRAGENNKARALTKLKTELTDYLDEVNPMYAAARLRYAGDSAMINAAELGRDVFKPKVEGKSIDLDELKGMVLNYSEPERLAFQQGVIKAIDDRLSKVPDTADNARRLWRDRDTRERIGLAFPNQAEFDEFLGVLDKESAFTNTLRDLYQGSQTAPRQAGAEALKQSAADVPNTFVDAMYRLFSEKITPEGEQELAKLLFDKSTSNEEIRTALLNAGIRPAGGWTKKTIDNLRQAWPLIWKGLPPAVTTPGGAAVLSETLMDPTLEERRAQQQARQFLEGRQ